MSEWGLSDSPTVGVLSTASPVNPSRLTGAVDLVSSWGWRVKIPFDPTLRYGALVRGFGSADKEVRAQAVHDLFTDPEVEAIICVRGGYGTVEILPLLDWDLIKKHPKPLVGFSDCTPLLLLINERSNGLAVHGPAFAVEFAAYEENSEAKSSVDSLIALLKGQVRSYSLECTAISPGSGNGRLLGGNLTMLASVLGSSWDVSYDEAVLFIEDAGEAPYRVHRLLTQLAYAGKFERLQGLVMGEFSWNEEQGGPKMSEVLEWAVSGLRGYLDCPVLSGLPVGHNKRNLPLPIGALATITGSRLVIQW